MNLSFFNSSRSQLTLAGVESSRVGSKALGRTIAYFVVICTLLVGLSMTVLDGGAGDPVALEPTVPQAEPAMATLPTFESQSTTATADAEAQSPARSEANILVAIARQPLPDVVSPPWADEMEGVILNYIAQRPGLELTELQVQCAEEQCVIFLGGNSIPIYEMGFDVFASEHGFTNAVIQSMDGGPNRLVYLRR
jgi:hypothetical protein